MKVFSVSDLHLECRADRAGPDFVTKLSPIAEEIDLLVLAGDIGDPFSRTYADFLDACLSVLQGDAHIILVAGNHETYKRQRNATVDETLAQIRRVVSTRERVHFLERESWKHPNGRLVVHGCTLWSKAPFDPSCVGLLNDFSEIPDLRRCESDRKRALSVYRKWHERDRDWLSSVLPPHHHLRSEKEKVKHLVVTHHLPTFRLVHERRFGGIERPVNHFFASALDDLLERSDMWLCGHSHESRVLRLPNTIAVLNPVGYVGEARLTECDWTTLHELL